jgi:myo-inositol-1(or 4)-monophosphatase
VIDPRGLLARIERGFDAARHALAPFRGVSVQATSKADMSPVTAADHAVNLALRNTLPQTGEGWLSEETADDARRLQCDSLWIIDPIDGTREFIHNIPEWCVSIAYVHRGHAIAGGIFNPATNEVILGALGAGVTYNGSGVTLAARNTLSGAVVLASRSEIRRGEWTRFENQGFELRPLGSVAYKLGLVAAALAEATWTLSPKNEWDVAAGAALVAAAGGIAANTDFTAPVFNRPDPRVPGFLACVPGLDAPLRQLLHGHKV